MAFDNVQNTDINGKEHVEIARPSGYLWLNTKFYSKPTSDASYLCCAISFVNVFIVTTIGIHILQTIDVGV